MKTFKSPVYIVGAVLLLIAAASSFILSGTKLGVFESIPGCGVGSGCDAVTNGPWGVVPGTSIYVSVIGFAWFIALLSVYHCCVANRRVGGLFLWSVRVGVLASVGFVILMFVLGSFCKWCALSHLCNILFWGICEFWINKKSNDNTVQAKTSAWGFWLNDQHVFCAFWIRFLVAMFVLWNVGRIHSENKLESEKKLAAENTERIASGDSVDSSTLALLEGGHRMGSPEAPIQVVMFTDYQCPDCKRIEGQLATIMASREDISVVVKHFPLNYECNDEIGTFKLHANACWAARAAEAAYIVGGEEAWEKMHTWLFSQKGEFTDRTFAGSLTGLGFNAQEIINIMMEDETLEIVKSNAKDGKALGVFFTPMVFINGVEYLWYYGGGESLQQVLNKVAQNISNGESEISAPPTASEKLVEDWRRGKTQNVPTGDTVSWMGEGEIEVVVWGDYQAELSKDIDREIQSLLEIDDSNIRYTFRHFPVDENCNAGVSNMPTQYNGSCELAKLVIACNALGGDSARWSMHNWILSQQTPINLESATDFAVSITGVDAPILNDVMSGIDVNNQMRADIYSKNKVWRKSIPVLMIDNRYVPRWRSDNVPAAVLFQRILSVIEEERLSEVKTSR